MWRETSNQIALSKWIIVILLKSMFMMTSTPSSKFYHSKVEPVVRATIAQVIRLCLPFCHLEFKSQVILSAQRLICVPMPNSFYLGDFTCLWLGQNVLSHWPPNEESVETWQAQTRLWSFIINPRFCPKPQASNQSVTRLLPYWTWLTRRWWACKVCVPFPRIGAAAKALNWLMVVPTLKASFRHPRWWSTLLWRFGLKRILFGKIASRILHVYVTWN